MRPIEITTTPTEDKLRPIEAVVRDLFSSSDGKRFLDWLYGRYVESRVINDVDKWLGQRELVLLIIDKIKQGEDFYAKRIANSSS